MAVRSPVSVLPFRDSSASYHSLMPMYVNFHIPRMRLTDRSLNGSVHGSVNGSINADNEDKDSPDFPETNDSVQDEDHAEETDCDSSPIRAGVPPQPELTVSTFSQHTRRKS